MSKDLEKFVTKELCTTRYEALLRERKLLLQPVVEDIAEIKINQQLMFERLNNFGKEIVNRAVEANHGEITVKPPIKDRILVYGSVVATIILIAREILAAIK